MHKFHDLNIFFYRMRHDTRSIFRTNSRNKFEGTQSQRYLVRIKPEIL
jgi:hypothetical protein